MRALLLACIASLESIVLLWLIETRDWEQPPMSQGSIESASHTAPSDSPIPTLYDILFPRV